MNKWWLIVHLLWPRERGRAMAWLTLVGVAIGVATLVVTLAIIDGFGSAYRDGLVRFNAPVMIMREDEKIDAHIVQHAIDAVQAQPMTTCNEGTLARAAWMQDWWWALTWRWSALTRSASAWSWLHDLLDTLAPRRIVQNIAWPRALVRWRDDWQLQVRACATHGVTARSPFVMREGLLVGHGAIRGVILRGVDPDKIDGVLKLAWNLHQPGTLAENLRVTPTQPLPIVIGSALAEQLGTHELSLFLPDRQHGVDTPLHAAQVVGTFTSGLYELDSQSVLLPRAALQKIYGVANLLTGVDLQLDAIEKAPWIAQELSAALGPEYQVSDWRALHRDTFEAIAMEKILFGLVMAVLVLVAAMNIVTTMLLRIVGRYRSVAILHAIGCSARTLQQLFFWQGLLLGATGVGAGLLLGSGMAWLLPHLHFIHIDPEIYFLTSIPTHVDAVTMMVVAGFGLCICTIAARRAARRVAALPILSALGRGYL